MLSHFQFRGKFLSIPLSPFGNYSIPLHSQIVNSFSQLFSKKIHFLHRNGKSAFILCRFRQNAQQSVNFLSNLTFMPLLNCPYKSAYFSYSNIGFYLYYLYIMVFLLFLLLIFINFSHFYIITTLFLLFPSHLNSYLSY